MASVMSKVLYVIFKKTTFKQKLKKVLESKTIDAKNNKKPSFMMMKKYHGHMDQIFNRDVYTFIHHDQSVNQTILYLHGGAFLYGFNEGHFRLFKTLIKKTHCKIIAPDYPLLNDGDFSNIHAFLQEVLKKIKLNDPHKEIILMGDSAGGGLALSLAEQLYQKNKTAKFHLLLLSPWLDLSMSDQDLSKTKDLDPILDFETLKLIGQRVAANQDVKNPIHSPIYGSLQGIQTIGLWTGTYDLLYIDALRLVEKAKKQNLHVDFYVYQQMMHTWFLFGLFESSKAIHEMIEHLKKLKKGES